MKRAGWTMGLIALAGAAACNSTPGVARPVEPTIAATTTQTGPEIPPVKTPRTVEPFLSRPCAVLDDADIEALGLANGDSSERTSGRSATCRLRESSADRTVRINLVDDELLRFTYETDANPGEFALIDVGGHPATRSTVGRGCRIVVAVADEQGFWVAYEPGRDEPDDEACATAIDVAGSILDRLPLA